MKTERQVTRRRRFLQRAATVGTIFLAGCSFVTERETETEMETPPTESPTRSPERTTAEPTEAETTTPERGEYPGYENLPDPLSVDSSNPFVYINDQSTDNYMGELALAMADSETVDLRGFLLGYPREVWKNAETYREHREEYVTNHRRTYRKAVESGMENLPSPELGLFTRHWKPSSGEIADTTVVGSPGTDRIVREARAASPENPLVVAVGGDLCTVADAYLTDPSIADSLVVYWHEQVEDINGSDGYNVQNSGWSAYVVLERLATVLDHSRGGYTITTEEVEANVPSPLDEFMMTKEHWKWGNPLQSTDFSNAGESDAGDEKALLLAAYPSTRGGSNRLSVSGIHRAEWDYGDRAVLPRVAQGEDDAKLVEIPEIVDSKRMFWQSWE